MGEHGNNDYWPPRRTSEGGTQVAFNMLFKKILKMLPEHIENTHPKGQKVATKIRALLAKLSSEDLLISIDESTEDDTGRPTVVIDLQQRYNRAYGDICLIAIRKTITLTPEFAAVVINELEEPDRRHIADLIVGGTLKQIWGQENTEEDEDDELDGLFAGDVEETGLPNGDFANLLFSEEELEVDLTTYREQLRELHQNIISGTLHG